MKPSRNGSKTTAATSKDSHKIFLIGVKNPLSYKLYSESDVRLLRRAFFQQRQAQPHAHKQAWKHIIIQSFTFS